MLSKHYELAVFCAVVFSIPTDIVQQRQSFPALYYPPPCQMFPVTSVSLLSHCCSPLCAFEGDLVEEHSHQAVTCSMPFCATTICVIFYISCNTKFCMVFKYHTLHFPIDTLSRVKLYYNEPTQVVM